MNRLSFPASVVIMFLGLFNGSNTFDDTDDVDHQDPWQWKDEHAKLAHYLDIDQSMYEIELVGIDHDRFLDSGWLRVCGGRHTLIEVEAHGETPFIIHGSVFVYAKHHPISSGCSLVAWDLSTQKELWSQHMIGVGPVAHSRYRNQVILKKIDDEILVLGLESAGRYIESVDFHSGRRTGHKKMPRE